MIGASTPSRRSSQCVPGLASPGAGGGGDSTCVTVTCRPPPPPSAGREWWSRRDLSLPAARHGDSELLLGRGGRELADDLALVDDEDAIGEGQDLLELERDQQHGAALVALLDEPAVHELDRPHVEAARRLRRDEDARIAVDLAR